MLILLWIICYFYPRPLRGGRRFFRCAGYFDLRFLSTPSARRATTVFRDSSTITKISIHALCEEGDVVMRMIAAWSMLFLSTPSARRATTKGMDAATPDLISIHALCEEGDLLHGREQHHRRRISIHALCEEGDSLLQPQQTTSWYFYPRPLRGGRLDEVDKYPGASKFLSTPSARRATRVITSPRSNQNISIHALCEEGDYKRTAKSAKVRDFYPRPLRGGRPFNEIHKAKLRYISIHALCEEGDQSSSSTSKICSYFYPRPLRGGRHMDDVTIYAAAKFLSTPSARRATRVLQAQDQTERISIHALCEEGDDKAKEKMINVALFLSTPSARRATESGGGADLETDISIHALCEEGDAVLPSPARGEVEISIHALCEEGDPPTPLSSRLTTYFYPRPLRGGRPAGLGFQQLLRDISIHALCEEGDNQGHASVLAIMISIHALCEEGDGSPDRSGSQPRYFYPRPLRGGRRGYPAATRATVNFYPRPLRGGRRHQTQKALHQHQFLSTPSARRATSHVRSLLSRLKISIHALCEEGDCRHYSYIHCPAHFYPRPLRGGRPPIRESIPQASLFLSTPSARRATQLYAIHRNQCRFLSTPSARRATREHFGVISPDSNFYPRPLRGGRPTQRTTRHSAIKFLSTPSARRATHRMDGTGRSRDISIHALCEEGDDADSDSDKTGKHISIHALCEEGDHWTEQHKRAKRRFLSTPSARRATAKTETKSLFSNKLYNILHEFRRALIYNGSKSYPNHAK